MIFFSFYHNLILNIHIIIQMTNFLEIYVSIFFELHDVPPSFLLKLQLLQQNHHFHSIFIYLFMQAYELYQDYYNASSEYLVWFVIEFPSFVIQITSVQDLHHQEYYLACLIYKDHLFPKFKTNLVIIYHYSLYALII